MNTIHLNKKIWGTLLFDHPIQSQGRPTQEVMGEGWFMEHDWFFFLIWSKMI